jgi:DNA-binding transcriptional LysR family regulator
MRYINYLNLSMYHIMLFLSLSENLNYTKTAEECCVTQSTLSRVIIQLENTIGIQLFIRNTSKVVLTPAGRSLYQDLKNLYGVLEDAVQKAYRIQKGKNCQLNLGINDGMNISAELLAFIKSFQEKHPSFEINFIRDYDHTLIKKLRDQTCDVIFDFTLKEKDDPLINSEPLFTGPMMLYMLTTNPLCHKEMLSLSDLRSQRLLVQSPSMESEQMEMIHKMFTDEGMEPRFSAFVSNALELSLNIKDDNEAILADRYYVDRYCPFLCARPIEGTKSTVWVRWMKGFSEETDIELFVDEILQFYSAQS